MTERQYKNFIQKNLHFISDVFVRSEEEADQLARECNCSVQELINMAKKRSTLPETMWAPFDYIYNSNFDSNHTRRSKRKNRQMYKTKRAVTNKQIRVLVACIVLVIVVGFFTLVPYGRAVARGIFDYFTRVTGNVIIITEKGADTRHEKYGTGSEDNSGFEQSAAKDSGPADYANIETKTVYQSIEEFRLATKLKPIELSDGGLQLVDIIEFDHLYNGKTLVTVYHHTKYGDFVLTQEWYTDKSNQKESNSAFDQEAVILGNYTMYYAIDSIDQSFNGVSLLSGSILMVYASPDYPIEYVIKILS